MHVKRLLEKSHGLQAVREHMGRSLPRSHKRQGDRRVGELQAGSPEERSKPDLFGSSKIPFGVEAIFQGVREFTAGLGRGGLSDID